MPRRRQIAGIVQLFDAVTQPVYALDSDHKIVYVNPAAQAWLGGEAATLVGQECRFHSEPAADAVAPLAAQLCPPPEAFHGQSAWQVIDLNVGISHAGESRARRFDFLPLASADSGAFGVLAIAHDETPTAQAPTPTTFAAPAGALHAALEQFRREQRAAHRVDQLIGVSPAARQLRARVAAAQSATANVLVLGRAGSRAEALARTIHFAAGRASAPLVPLSCPLLGPELVQATVRGLSAPRAGAERATLLLLDVDELPAEAQASLVEQFGQRDLPFRIIATASAPLFDELNEPRLLADLAWRVSELVIATVPLAERPADVPLVAQALLEQVNASINKQLAGFTDEALDQLCAYHWPDDLDELADVVGQAHAAAEGPRVSAADLPRRLYLAADAQRRARKPEETIVLEDFLGEIERELLVRALRRAKGNKTRAAKLLGMTRPRLYRRLVQLGLEPGDRPPPGWPT
ncbi:MAG: sigma 54-interacting transcriptional regulator [Planctomycetes bacterium]|nr:sigma 54-interacting transcriptional regulator [Planctomycetota bacterium]